MSVAPGNAAGRSPTRWRAASATATTTATSEGATPARFSSRSLASMVLSLRGSSAWPIAADVGGVGGAARRRVGGASSKRKGEGDENSQTSRGRRGAALWYHHSWSHTAGRCRAWQRRDELDPTLGARRGGDLSSLASLPRQTPKGMSRFRGSPPCALSPSLRARAGAAGEAIQMSLTVIASASVSEREAIQDGRASAVDSGLLRRLRRLAMTVETPPRHCERERERARSNPEVARPHGTPPAHDSRHRPPGLLRRL